MSNQMTFADIASAISSPGLLVGLKPLNLRDGPLAAKSGQGLVPVLHSVPPGRKSSARTAKENQSRIRERLVSLLASIAVESGTQMADISGRISIGSSKSAALQLRLASRLRERTDLSGSPEYVLRWKSWDMPLGQPICALRASARRTSDNAFTGWPTPNALEFGASNIEGLEKRRQKYQQKYGNNGFGLTLGQTVMANVAGWPTPKTSDTTGAKQPGNRAGGLDLKGAVAMAGWATPHTPRAHDSDETALKYYPSKKQIGIEHQAHGLIPAGTSAGTESTDGYRLNPRFSLWLMGFPAEWHSSGERAMQSAPKQPRRSSKRT